MNLAETVKKNNRLASLVAIRDYLANRLDAGVEPKSVAPITKELRDTILEIDQIPQPRKGAVTDDISKRRAERFASPKIRIGTGS